MLPSLLESCLLFAAGIAAGAINAVAGGGTFIAFPTMVFTGVPPLAANASCTISVWPAAVASVYAYRRQLLETKPLLPVMLFIGFLGGTIGSVLLLKTPEQHFAAMIPWLMLLAMLVFAFGKHLNRWLERFLGQHPSSAAVRTWLSRLLQLAVAVYGGYFGAGMGILTLAVLQILGLNHIHTMNALKIAIGTAINTVAVIIFAAAGVVWWPHATIMMIGGMIGGYFGARIALKVSPEIVRGIVMAIAVATTVWFFIKPHI